ncbi:hypothetical protein GCM10027036_22220 [Flavihumibacter cheonanensis]|uniref:PAS domain S-box protein n=1 Tax=Flavihumibacter cheonanensis TaxID=1442385 RepID=UPI001EF99819|nr:PAS domain S-box protein [Flavihumibacter cheonanensis]MCG7754356.1 PAS domain S-box protein [Flavihumibacter cheonanensis]
MKFVALKQKGYLVLILSLLLIILGSVLYFRNLQHQQELGRQLVANEQKSNLLLELNTLQLKALRDKRGYQLNRLESMRFSYLQHKQQAAALSRNLVNQFRTDSLLNQIELLKRITEERFADWDRQLMLFATLPEAEANQKIREYISKNIPLAERWEENLVGVQNELNKRSEILSGKLDKLSDQNNISFIILLVVVIGLLTWSYFALRNQDYMKERNETAMRINAAIRSSRQEFSSAFEFASIGMALVSLDGKFTRVNSSLCKLLGYSSKELKALSFQEITHPDDLNTDLGYVEKMLSGEIDSYSMEKRYFRKDGSIIWINLSGSKVNDAEGKPLYFIAQIENINEWKKAQTELLQQKERISNILEGTHAGTWEWNVQTGETRFNAVWAEIIGYTLEELGPISIETWLKYAHPDDLAESERRLKACFNREADFYECECRMKHKDGHYVWVLDRGKVMSWTEDGKPLWMFGTHLDITKSKELELQLVQQKAFIDSVLQTINVGIVVCNNEGRLTLFNNATRQMHGIEEKDLPAEEWGAYYQLFEADKKTHLTTERIPLYRAWKGESPIISEMAIKHRSGKMIDVLATGTKVIGAGGETIGAVVAMTDVTQLNTIRQQLAESEAKFRGIFNSTLQFIGFLKLDGELIEANQTALDFAGLTVEDVKGKKFWDCYWWQKDEQTKTELQQAIAKAAAGESVVYEVEVLGKNQQIITILFSLKPLFDSSGKVVAIIPEGRPIDEIVQARHQLEQKNEELEQFASIAAHDLKEPLRMVGNFMSLLKAKHSSQLDSTALKYVDFAVNGSNRMSQLITDLLDYAKVGSEEVPFESIDPEPMLLDILSLNDSLITEKGVKVSWSKLPSFRGQQTAIKLLFQNLIMNGIKYQEPDHAPVIRITGKELAENWLFSIEDNGIGIPAQYHEKIFQVFTRLHSKDKYSGTGMGLATCKKIVTIHGGRIWVESKEGEGSCFHFTISKSV